MSEIAANKPVKKLPLRSVGIFLLSAIGFISIAELTIGHFLPSAYPNIVRASDGSQGYVPGMRGAFRSGESRFLFPLLTNEDGLRNELRPLQPIQGEIDIAVIGNSFVDAAEMRHGQRFTELAESQLRASGLAARIFNLGVRGQYMASYFDKALFAEAALRPSKFVIAITVSSDFIHNSMVFYRGTNKILWNVESDLGRKYEIPVSNFEQFYVAARRFLYNLWVVRIAVQLAQQMPSSLSQTQAGEETNICPGALGGTSPHSAFVLNRSVLEELHERLGSRLLVLLIPDPSEMKPDAKLDCAWNRAEEWLKDLAAKGIDTLSTREALKRHKKETFFNRGHLNHDGHVIVGNLLAEKLAHSLKP